MDQFQQQQEQQQQQRQQTAAMQSYDNNTPNYTCPHCGAAVDFHMELCPHCHHPLHPDICTYCGAEMEPEDQFCCECGGPRKGITCPICGTLNFRSFCSHCNTPLYDLARAEVEKAQRDPVYQKAVSLAEQMAELEEQIMAAEREARMPDDGGDFDVEEEEEVEELDFETVMEHSEEDKKLMEQYHQLLGTTPTPINNTPKPTPKPQQQVQQKKKVDKKARVGGADLAAMKAEYQRQMQEMQSLLNAMQPDANATPQMQRNFCCAHKVVVTTQRLVRRPTTWICNYCGCEHNQPSECTRPELGGVWKYNSYTETIRTIETR